MATSTNQTVDADEVNKKITEYIKKYEATEEDDEIFWCELLEDFAGWTIEHFQAANRTLNTKLRYTMRMKGIWVETDSKKMTLPTALTHTLSHEDPPRWTKKDLLLLKTDGSKGKIKSDRLLAKLALAEANDPCLDMDFETAHEPTTLQLPSTPYTPQSMTRESPQRLAENSDVRDFRNPIKQGTPQRTIYPTSYEFKTPYQALPQIPQQTPAPHAGSTEVQGPSLQLPCSHVRELTTVVKMYTEEMKYGSGGDNFNLKLVMFYDICNRAGLPPEAFRRALPSMLKGMAQSYYYSTLINSNLTFEAVCQDLQNHFEDASYKRCTLNDWNLYTLSTVINKHPEKTTTECFEIMLDKLQNLYHGLEPDLQTERFMHNKLVTACQSVPDCQIACATPAPTLTALISTLKTAILAYEYTHKKTTSETFMTDRRYQSNRNNYGRNNYGRGNSGQDRRPERFKKKRCFVCHEEDCWSTNHSESEQQAAKNRFKAKHSTRFNSGKNNRYEKVLRQYIAQYEGTEEESLSEEVNAIFLEDDPDESDDDSTSVFLTTLGNISQQDARRITLELSNQAFLHSIFCQPVENFDESPVGELSLSTSFMNARYHDEKFFGILIDTGASKKSTVGYGQYLAYNTICTTPICKTREGEVKIKFGIGTASSIGSITLDSPIGRIDFHVIRTDTPFLLCLADMDRLKVHFNNVKNVLETQDGEIPIVRKFGHPFLVWSEVTDTSPQELPCYLTEVEIRRLHKRFGHPSVERLGRVLERAGHEVDNEIIEHLTKYCKYCQKYGKSPGRFRFSLREDVNFNYCIYVDIMYIDGQPLLHIVDEGTRYQNGKWLINISAKHVWDKLQECWINTYLRPPDLLVHDAGKSFMSKEFKHYAGNQGITTKDVPVEAHNSIGLVERYHGPVRRAYKIISEELPDLDKDAALQMAFKAINDIVGPDATYPPCSALRDLIDTNKLNIQATEWVERGDDADLEGPGLQLRKHIGSERRTGKG